MPSMTLHTIGAVHRIAERIVDRLWTACKAGRIASINIDVIRAACGAVVHYEGLSDQELLALEERVLRRIIEKVG